MLLTCSFLMTAAATDSEEHSTKPKPMDRGFPSAPFLVATLALRSCPPTAATALSKCFCSVSLPTAGGTSRIQAVTSTLAPRSQQLQMSLLALLVPVRLKAAANSMGWNFCLVPDPMPVCNGTSTANMINRLSHTARCECSLVVCSLQVRLFRDGPDAKWTVKRTAAACILC